MRTIEFRNPERIAMSCPAPFPNDFAGAGIRSAPDAPTLPRWKTERSERWKDEWGNTWERVDTRVSGEVVEGAITDWSQLESYRMPNLDDERRFTGAEEIFAKNPDKYRIGWLPGFPFSIGRNIRKLEFFLEDLVAHPDEIRELCNRIADLLDRIIRIYARLGADGVMFCEDWGCQDRLMISPRMWRTFFRPYFERLGGLTKQLGIHLLMHSCGYVYDIIPDLVECGVRVLQFDQPRLHGIERLSKNFGGKVAFWCPVDIQTTLQTGDREKIRADAKLMIEKLGCFGGGFIGGYYGSNEGIGAHPDWQKWACEAFLEYGTYRK